MPAKIKVLLCGLIALTALSVAPVSAGASPRLTTSLYPAILEGAQLGASSLVLSGGRVFGCSAATLSGTYTEAESKAEEATVGLRPEYEGCTSTFLGNTTEVTITPNGCQYVLAASEAASGKAKEEGWEYTGSATLKCPEGKAIEAHVFELGATKHEKTPLCTYKVAAQGPLKSVDYKLAEAGTKVVARASLSGVAVTKLSGTLTNCGAASQTATYSAEAELEAVEDPEPMLKASFDPK